MKSLFLVVLLCGAAGFLACSGTGGGKPSPPSPPSCPTGAVTLNPTTIMVGGTSTASAPSGWTGGSFSPSPSGIVTVAGSTVTGVSAGSATISGSGWTAPNAATGCALSSTAITVNPAVPTITSLTPSVFRCDAECGMVAETMFGSSFEVGDFVKTMPDAWLQLVQLVNARESLVTMGLDTSHTSPGSFTFSDCRGTTTTTCSNSWSIALAGNQNDLVTSPSGELYNLDRAAGNIWKFKADGTSDSEIADGCPSGEVSITFDAAHKWIWTNCSTGSYAYDAVAGNLIRGGYDGDDLSDSDANNGIYCGTEAISKNLACLADANMATDSVFAYAPAGVEPWSVTMITLGLGTQSQETDAFVYDREGALYDFVVTIPAGSLTPTITLKSFPPSQTANPLILNGLTAADTLTGTGNGGWYLTRFETGPAAGTVALLSAYDKTIVFVNASTMTETKRVILSPAVYGSGTPFRIAADETNGRVVVALANVGAATSTSFLAVTPAGVVTPLAAVAQNIIAVGLGVSSDGTKIYACMRDQCAALQNQ